MHRKREYNRSEGLTLCGIHVGKGWWIVSEAAKLARGLAPRR
jgi:hypothetical protein